MFVSPSFLNALGSELASGRYPLKAGTRSPALVDGAEFWLPSDRVERFVSEALRALDDEAGGLCLGQRAPYTMLHVLGHLLLECATLQEMFSVMQRYSGVLFEGVSWYMVDNVRDYTEIGFRFEAQVSEKTDRFWSEWMLGLLVRLASELFDTAPREVGCAHGAPRYAARYEQVFDCPVRFGQLTSWLRFPCEVLELEPTPRDAGLFCLLREAADRALHARTAQRSYSERVRDALLRQQDLARVDLQRIAKLLGTTQRMLRRRLQEEGQTVSNVISELRCELAKRALSEGDESLKEIADRLGYSEPSAFHRAFRRWTGLTPAKFRGSPAHSEFLETHSGGSVTRPTISSAPMYQSPTSSPLQMAALPG